MMELDLSLDELNEIAARLMNHNNCPNNIVRARNWGLVCGFGYGFAAATFAFLILLFVTAPHA